MNKKSVLVFLITILYVFIGMDYSKCYCDDVSGGKKVLIIGSYSPANKWESSILQGFENSNDRYWFSKLFRQAIIKVWSTFSKVVGVGKAHKYSLINQLV